jgi:hypothetical protein
MGQAISGITAAARLPGIMSASKSNAVECLGGYHFYVVNDNVMGGRSESTIKPMPERGLFFSGVVDKNGGGFVACRTNQNLKPVEIPSGAVSMLIRVEGDGKQYKASLSDGNSGGPFASAPTYSHDFKTKAGQEESIVMPLCDFKPSFGGRLGRDQTPLDPSKMVQMGFALSYLNASCKPNESVGEDKTEFSLRIADVRFGLAEAEGGGPYIG